MKLRLLAAAAVALSTVAVSAPAEAATSRTQSTEFRVGWLERDRDHDTLDFATRTTLDRKGRWRLRSTFISTSADRHLEPLAVTRQRITVSCYITGVWRPQSTVIVRDIRKDFDGSVDHAVTWGKGLIIGDNPCRLRWEGRVEVKDPHGYQYETAVDRI